LLTCVDVTKIKMQNQQLVKDGLIKSKKMNMQTSNSNMNCHFWVSLKDLPAKVPYYSFTLSRPKLALFWSHFIFSWTNILRFRLKRFHKSRKGLRLSCCNSSKNIYLDKAQILQRDRKRLRIRNLLIKCGAEKRS
jgi:hypothetical protein